MNQFNTSLWGDEAFSAVLSQNPVSKILEIISRDTSPPLYNLCLHFWYQYFGTSEVSIRVLSFVFFILAIFFVYKMGALLFNKKTGILAALLSFLNPFFFTYAFEGRMYSILALGVCSSTFFFLRILYPKEDNENKKKNKIKPTPFWLIPSYAISTAWALYSHHFAIFAVFIQFIIFLYEFIFGKRNSAKKIFKGLVFAAILYTPWLYPLYKQTKMVGSGFWLGIPTLADLGNLITTYLAEGIKNPKINIPYFQLSLSKLSLYLVFTGLILRNWMKAFKKSFYLILFFLGPILLTWGVSQKFQSIFFDRYLLYTIPYAMLILASNKRRLSKIIVALVILLFLITDINYFTHPTKRPFRQLAEYTQNTQQEGDFLINWNSGAHHLWESKYYNIPAPIYVPEGNLPFYTGTAQMTQNDIINNIPDAKRIGVITSGLVEEIIISGYTTEDFKEFGELKIVYLVKQ